MIKIWKKVRSVNWQINLCNVNGLLVVSAVLAAVIVITGTSQSNLMRFEQNLAQQIK